MHLIRSHSRGFVAMRSQVVGRALWGGGSMGFTSCEPTVGGGLGGDSWGQASSFWAAAPEGVCCHGSACLHACYCQSSVVGMFALVTVACPVAPPASGPFLGRALYTIRGALGHHAFVHIACVHYYHRREGARLSIQH